MRGLLPGRSRIGVVELHGVLGTTLRTSVYHQLLDRLERNPRIGCVVLDIDSPGGSVAASENLYLKVSRLRSKKPVIAFIRGTGASGAYLVACGASRIVAVPGAIVGSIGVISFRPVVAELLERLGIRVSVAKSGSLKDMGAIYRPPTPEEEVKIQGLVDELFEGFVERIAKARRMELDQVRGYATGEVYTSGKGKELGLVDELGDFDTVLDMAASLGHVSRRVEYVRPPRPLQLRLLDRFASWALAPLVEEAGDATVPRFWYL